MKAMICFLLATAVAAGAAGGSIVSSFESPARPGMGFTPCGIEYYGGYLYHVVRVSDTPPYSIRLYRTTLTGSVLSSDYTRSNTLDIDIGGDGTWYLCSGAPGYAYHYNTNGSLLSSFSLTTGDGGIAYDGSYVWAGFFNGIRRFSTTGSALGTINYPGTPYIWQGLDMAGDDFWFGAGGNGSYYVARGDQAGSILESFPYPHTTSTESRIRGTTWDGNYLWVTTYTTGGFVWVYRLTTEDTAITPSSLGKLKAIYR